MSNFLNVNVVYVYVKNWEEAKKFYSELLGWPVAYLDDGMGWMEFGVEGATHFAISRWGDTSQEPARGRGNTITLGVENEDELVVKLRSLGIRCDEPMRVPGVVTLCDFYDLEGNRLQMVSEG
jgi:predicted enzyme related to lactoylglutathione lyase